MAARYSILVTGGSGQVGEALRRTLAPLGEIVAPSSAELNLANADSIRSAMRRIEPRWVVNAGAHTAVDKAESEPERAMAINAIAPAVFADEAKKIGGAVIHFSTDYVFDGSKPTPYVETDETGPLNEYGRSKLAGERALSASGASHLIFRTSWVYGATGNNFVKSMLRLGREREHLKIVADQHGGPTWSYELARMTAHVIGQLEAVAVRDGASLDQAVQPVTGIYHATGAGATTWFEFAKQAIAELQKLQPDTRLAEVEAIPTAQYPTPAKRPVNSVLDCGKLERVFGWKMPEWSESLAAVVGELAG
ncbi:MAG TPA: dTDP-4-dehydrorhamnose reductase [Acidobacteriaceae bacterium]|nr:dTDP-4-dehydrorhamnose reductase [Acidobacteriaceae bacterium]